MDKDEKSLFPHIQHAIKDFMFEEEANIPRNKVLTIGAMMLVLNFLLIEHGFAKHKSHTSHTVHGSHTTHGSHTDHSSHGSHTTHSTHTTHVTHSDHATHATHMMSSNLSMT